jgi:2-keto-4-pentenoate hydratase/2-oxohepta-3-ene-1,7-dioic acid hydratase in catechol pathway
MKLVMFKTGRGAAKPGVLTEAGVHDFTGIEGAPTDVAGCAAISAAALRKVAKAALARKPKPLAKLTLTAPIPKPARNIFCVGKNYHEHAKEFAQSGFDSTAKEVVPEAPVVFTKPPSAVSGPGDIIPASLDNTKSVDYEGELAVVIGKGGRGITKANAMKHIFGYTIVNDVTSRKLQQLHRQWVIGKGIDGFCPMGPCITTADDIPDPTTLRLKTHVNKQLRQDAVVKDLIFDIPTLIETISRYITLQSGDVIATGTPVGVGIGFTPPKFLKKGDVVRIEIDRIGVLENKVG